MSSELLRTTRAFRKRLDLTRPVARRDLLECLDIAVHAPSGTNRQPWRFVIVQDADTRQAIAEYYRKAFSAYLSARTPRPDQLGDLESGRYLADHLHEVPALVLVCSLGRPPADGNAHRLASFYGSIYPAVWNFLLALHDRGMGATMTTAHLVYEREIADLLSIPFDEVTQVALLPVAHLRPGSASPAPRRAPADEVTYWDRWNA
ncbi:nitroreductase family protein [Nocardia puris]|uniref:Nitroreductase n=1 Tax=Nocardia puris TaxID=208602 RepID=A0A366DEF3_9NOCA|nr:nitroreductase family protein [Nocardia puris]MBF6212029.1 nitroreductase family protein [Nocardia puris]MBF6367055.1 nitroreductase family protein [Nocardia puris]MBF6461968.1 nitroreductase family protein [Nocardia puris]RBO88423.1 nitroreductase [Nocardia puris]